MCCVAAAQHGAHPRHDLARAERLGDVVVGPQLKADDPVGLLTPRRQHDDRDLRIAPNGAGDVKAVEFG